MENSLVLTRQSEVRSPPGWETRGWGESDVEEIVAKLEFVYENRDAARRIGLVGRQWLIDNGRTWRAHAAALKKWLLEEVA